MSKPIFIFLDTNNWIYLANGFNVLSKEHDDLHLKIFEIIERRVEDYSFVFLINDIILKEFIANKAHTEAKIKKIENKAEAYEQQLKAVSSFVPEEADRIKPVIEQVRQRAAQKIADQRAHIARVATFLTTKAIQIPISPENKIEAAEMAIAKKAPFIGDKKNSTADAVLLLSAVEYLDKNEKVTLDPALFGIMNGFAYFPTSYFVSSNSGDFSDPINKEAIHQDLEHILKRSNTNFYHNLNPLIAVLEKNLLTKEEAEAIESATDRWISCDICEFRYSHIEFRETIKIFDPHRGVMLHNPKQKYLFEEDKEKFNLPCVDLRLGECENCGADFIECPNCHDLVHAEQYNAKIPCTGCGYKFIIHAERDRKGIVYEREYEIVCEFKCRNCDEDVDAVNSDKLCEECAEFERIAHS